MKASDLRIGDKLQGASLEVIVLGIISDGVITVTGEDIAMLAELEKDGKEFTWKPIPISEEWLLKFGFERSNRAWASFENDYYLIDQAAFVDGGWDFRVRTSTTESVSVKRYLKYVHQLQNLYHALTGEELTLTS